MYFAFFIVVIIGLLVITFREKLTKRSMLWLLISTVFLLIAFAVLMAYIAPSAMP